MLFRGFCFFKQKTAYEMRISDWSSDVCSSDLGIAAANAGSLTFMVGGSGEAFERAEPFLADMGKAVIHAGANGAGQAAKICNNMILGATMIATCEASALAKKQIGRAHV